MAFIEREFDLSIRDIDKNTKLTNKAILSFFEDIGGIHSDIAGYGLNQIEKTRISWVLLYWKVKVLKPVKYGEKIKIKTWSRGIKLACCFRDFELYNSNNELCVLGTSKWTLYHLDKGLIRLTKDIVDKYSPEEKIAIDFDFKKIREPDNYSNVYEYTVSRSDIDINNHMHNLRYLDLAYEALPKDVYEKTVENNNNFNNVEIMYKKECYLEDKLKCYYSNVNNEHIITIKSDDDKTLNAIVKLY